MTHADTNGKTIKESFEAFDLANTHVYSAFEAEALRAAKRGRTKLSSKQIIGYIRWNFMMNTDDSESTFKINDSFTSHYARKFAQLNPGLKSLFNYRGLRSAKDEHILSNGVALKEIIKVEAYGVKEAYPNGGVRFGVKLNS